MIIAAESGYLPTRLDQRNDLFGNGPAPTSAADVPSGYGPLGCYPGSHN